MKNHTSPEAYLERLKTLGQVTKTSVKESGNRNIGTLIDYRKAADGINYGIIKENKHYYIKKGGLKKDPDASDFAYIGGLGNITDYQYTSLHEADKQRNMLMHVIGEAVSLKPDKNGSKKRLNEDRAGMEIDNAESKLGDLDAATSAAAEAEPDEVQMDAGLEAEPMGGEVGGDEAPPLAPEDGEGEEGMPAPEGEEEMPAPEGEEGLEGLEGGEEGLEGDESPDDAEMTMGDGADEATKELEKAIGKITNTIRKTELEPAQVKSYVNSYLSAFKDKFPELEIEDRKEMANKILKVVPPEDVEDLGDSMPPEEGEIEEEMEEEGCNECGTFAKYAESRGYGSAQALKECGEEEVSNLVSGYANAHNDGQNDGDLEGVALVIKVINPEILNSLKGDYGHDDYAQKLTPYVDGMNESTEEESNLKLEGLFSGIKNVARGIGGVAAQAGKNVGTAVGNAASAVGGAVQRGATAVGNAAQRVGTDIKHSYNQANVGPEVKKLESLANQFAAQVVAVDQRLKNAGQTGVDTQSLIAGITNQLRGTGNKANFAGTKAGAGVNTGFLKKEGLDPANVETQPPLTEEDKIDTEEKSDIQFAPAGQTLGGGIPKPDGAPTSIKVVSGNGTSVDVNLSEAKRKLIKQIAEGVNEYMNEVKPSAGLSKEKKSEVVKKAKAGEDIGKKGKGFDKVADKAAKEYGSKEAGKKVAAAAMWKNIKKEGEEEQEVMTESKFFAFWNNEKHEIEGNDLYDAKQKAIAMLKIPKSKVGLLSVVSAKSQDQEDFRFNESIKENSNTMTESEIKLRKYVRARLEEHAGLRTPRLNENEKSDTLKKLDSVIDKQFKLYESKVK